MAECNRCVATSSFSIEPMKSLVSQRLHLTKIAGKRSVLWDSKSMSTERLHKANDPSRTVLVNSIIHIIDVWNYFCNKESSLMFSEVDQVWMSKSRYSISRWIMIFLVQIISPKIYWDKIESVRKSSRVRMTLKWFLCLF